jgi:hypothetical protein
MCVDPNPYYRENVFGMPLQREMCWDALSDMFRRWHYKGDIFHIAGQTQAPFVTGKADNTEGGRVRGVTDRASEYGRTFMGDLKWQPPRIGGGPAAIATGSLPSAAPAN